MLNLDQLSKEFLNKIESVLAIILEYSDFKANNANGVLIPKTKFKDSRLSLNEVIEIINKIEKEENGIIKNVTHSQPFKPVEHFHSSVIVSYEETLDLYEREKREYEEKYEDNLDIDIDGTKKIRKLLERVIEKQNWLICGKLKLNIKSGDAIHEKGVIVNFKPESNEYKLLKALMENRNERLSYDRIKEILYSQNTEIGKTSGRDISFVIRNIKRKLKIPKKTKLFVACNGYKIVCDSKS